MTNRNNPVGGRAVGSFNAAKFDLKVNKYVTSVSDTTALYIGDAVKTTGTAAVDGTPVCTKAAAGEAIRGLVVAIVPLHTEENAVYRKASTERIVYVCDDPYISLEIQTNGVLAVTDIGKYANIVVNGGNDITGLSGTMVDLSSTSTDSRQLRIVSLIDRVDNEIGQYGKVLCVIHDHELAHGATGSQENIWKRVGTTISPFNAGDDVNLGTGDVTIGGKLTVVGLIDPTGLLLDPQGAAPGTNDGMMYYDSGSKTFQFREDGVWHSLGETSLWKRVGGELTPFTTDDPVDMKKGKIIYGDGTDTAYTAMEYNNASATKPALDWSSTVGGLVNSHGLHLKVQEANKGVTLHVESYTAAAFTALSSRNVNFTLQEFIGYMSTGQLGSGTRKYWSKQFDAPSANLKFQTINNAVITDRFILDFSTGIPTIPALNTAFGLVQTNGSGVFSTSVTLPDGTLATTQSPLDNSTKLATTAYVDAAVVVEDLWDRSVTTLIPKTADDNVLITKSTSTAVDYGFKIDMTLTANVAGVTGIISEMTTYSSGISHLLSSYKAVLTGAAGDADAVYVAYDAANFSANGGVSSSFGLRVGENYTYGAWIESPLIVMVDKDDSPVMSIAGLRITAGDGSDFYISGSGGLSSVSEARAGGNLILSGGVADNAGTEGEVHFRVGGVVKGKFDSDGKFNLASGTGVNEIVTSISVASTDDQAASAKAIWDLYALTDSWNEVMHLGNTFTVLDNENLSATITQNDTTNNPAALIIANTGTGNDITLNKLALNANTLSSTTGDINLTSVANINIKSTLATGVISWLKDTGLPALSYNNSTNKFTFFDTINVAIGGIIEVNTINNNGSILGVTIEGVQLLSNNIKADKIQGLTSATSIDIDKLTIDTTSTGFTTISSSDVTNVVTIDGAASSAILRLDRGATNQNSNIEYHTASVGKWTAGLIANESDDDYHLQGAGLWFTLNQAAGEAYFPAVYADTISTATKVLSIDSAGQIGESTTSSPTFAQVTVDSIVLNAAAITITENSTDFTFECKRSTPGVGTDLYIKGATAINNGASPDGGNVTLSTGAGVAGGVAGELYLQTGGVTKISITPDSFIISGGQLGNVTTVNAATYDLLVTDYIVHVTYTVTGAVTSLTLPTAQLVSGRLIYIVDAGGNAGANSITIDTQGAEKIVGQDTLVINGNYNNVALYTDGSNWFVL